MKRIALPKKNWDAPKVSQSTLVLIILSIACVIMSVDYTIVYVALPSIQESLGFSHVGIQWVISAYALAFGGFLLLGGRASDLLGRRRIFLLGLFLYGASSLAGGFATDTWIVVTARGMQGLGGACLFPATLSLVNASYQEGRERNRALAIWGGTGAAGAAAGSLVGGLIVANLGWEWIFFINVPIVIITATAAVLVLPKDPPLSAGIRIDVSSTLSGTATILFLILAFMEAAQNTSIAASSLVYLGLSLLSAGVFIFVERRARVPLVNVHLLTNPGLIAATAIAGIFMASFGGQYYLLTIWFQTVKGLSATSTGIAFLPLTVSIVLGTILGSRLANRFQARISILIGLAVGFLGMIFLGFQLKPHNSFLFEIVPSMVIDGMGQGITWTSIWIAASSGIKADQQGVSTGIVSTFQQVGGAMGLAVLVVVMTGMDDGTSLAQLNTGIRVSFIIASSMIVLGGVIAFFFLPRRVTS